MPSVVNAAIHYIFLNDYALKLKDELNKVRSDFESRVKGEEDLFENTDLSVVKLDANIRLSQAKLKVDKSEDKKFFENTLFDIYAHKNAFLIKSSNNRNEQ